jgi:hypothetical protein
MPKVEPEPAARAEFTPPVTAQPSQDPARHVCACGNPLCNGSCGDNLKDAKQATLEETYTVPASPVTTAESMVGGCEGCDGTKCGGNCVKTMIGKLQKDDAEGVITPAQGSGAKGIKMKGAPVKAAPAPDF